jgi:hypothetical protein
MADRAETSRATDRAGTDRAEADRAGTDRVEERAGGGRPEALWSDRVYGAIGIIAVVLAIVFLFVGGPKDGEQTAAAPGVPTLRLLEPAAGAAVGQPLTLVFDAGIPLTADGGNRDGSLHVHVRVGATELMSGPGSLQPLGGTRYRWALPALPPGDHTVRLYWSDDRHRVIEDGVSAPVDVTLR